MPFQKGNVPWNKGKRCHQISEALKGRSLSEEHCRNLSEALTGRKLSQEHTKNMSEAMKGKYRSEEYRKNISEAKKGENNPFYGKHHSVEVRRKQSETQKGEKSHRWKGGKIPYYGDDWRSQRRLVRERDDYTCLCGLEENGREHDVHHIIPYRISKDNSQDNLWTLCPKCHRRIEAITEINYCSKNFYPSTILVTQ